MSKSIKVLLLILFTLSAEARPISYSGGWTVMTKNDWFQNIVHVHYTPNINNSIGAVYTKMKEDETELLGVQWNHLLYRKNKKHSQGNIYLMSQAGSSLNTDTQFYGALAIAGDWETRRYFMSYWAGTYYANDLNNGEFSQKARVGIAPYVANYGSLHTWIMLQAEHRPEQDDKIILTPLVRFFKGIYLAEFGVNDNGDVLFNAIIRF